MSKKHVRLRAIPCDDEEEDEDLPPVPVGSSGTLASDPGAVS